MMQEEILKELELWPVWRLKVALPDIAAPDITIHDVTTSIVETTEALPEVVDHSPLLKAYESEDGRCVMLHDAGAFTQEEEKLWANICKAMRVKAALILQDARVEDLLNARVPAVLILFGEKAAQTVLQSESNLENLRGTQHFYQHLLTINVPAIVTYDLKHLLQQLPDKAKAWDDLRSALKLLSI